MLIDIVQTQKNALNRFWYRSARTYNFEEIFGKILAVVFEKAIIGSCRYDTQS